MREAYRSEELFKEQRSKAEHSQYDFFLMSQEKRSELAERIKRSRGKVFLFVHPSWANENEYGSDPDTKQRVRSVREGLSALSQLESEDIPPIFVLEKDVTGKDYDGPYGSRTKQDLYYIPTEDDGPQPVYKAYNREMVRTEGGGSQRVGKINNVRIKRSESNWEILANRLKEVGVEEIIIGGADLTFRASDWDENKELIKDDLEFLRFCVGGTIRKLAPHFRRIIVSRFTAPVSRQEVKEIVNGKAVLQPGYENQIPANTDNEN